MEKKDNSSRHFKVQTVIHALRTNQQTNGSSQSKKKWNSPKLTKEDSQVGILSIATFHSNCLGVCSLISKKYLKKRGRGSFDYGTDCNFGTHLLKWFDNKCCRWVTFCRSKKCTNTFKRYDLAQKKVKIDCSDMVSQYKQWMGGVDLVDMLIALCRTHIMIRRRWHLKIIFHCFDIAKVIGWFLYRRHCQQKDDSEKFQISLTTFTTQIAPAFILAGKDPQKNRWSAKMQHFSETSSQKKSSCSITSGRHPIWKNGALSWNWCQKCNVGLCLNKVRNCFKDFHH